MRNRLALITLLLQMLLVAAGLFLSGRFQAEIVPDTSSYSEFPFQSLDAALRYKRTPVYPCFLKLVSFATGSYDAVPVVQYLVFCGAVFVFYLGLLRIGASAFSAALIAGSLLTTNILWLYGQTVATDSIAAAAGIFAIGFVLQSVGSERQSARILAGLVISTTAAWLIRPAYLFLVPVVPILFTLLRVQTVPVGQSTFLSISRNGAKSVMLIGLPLFAWCVLRLCVVQSFGVVSFGGFNLVGIAGQFLDHNQVEQLPTDLQPLARQALTRRDQLPPDLVQMPDADRLNYLRMENNYDTTIWIVFSPAARDIYSDDDRVVNSQLRKIGTAILLISPRSYLVWLAKALRHGVFKIISDLVLNPVGLAVTLAAMIAAVVRIVGLWPSRSRGQAASATRATEILFVSAFFYSAICLGVTILVCPPLGRMTDAAAILWMPFITAVLLKQLFQAEGSKKG